VAALRLYAQLLTCTQTARGGARARGCDADSLPRRRTCSAQVTGHAGDGELEAALKGADLVVIPAGVCVCVCVCVVLDAPP
jgi:hypothetical protein